ncbi:MAG: L-threonylcarbamoyladenylate synthase [Spirochaetes bacterium]|nr:L-threonylcarbamoyladenylate synthase [Spirochaetota bacterium]
MRESRLSAPVKANKKTIKEAADIIRSGGLVAFPTETVYGLGANAMNPSAVAKIFEAKNRPFFDPIIVHMASIDGIEKLVSVFDEKARALAEKFWPGPLTIVMPRADAVPGIVTAGLDTVAVRVPDNETALELIRESGTVIAAPSANPFGYISPTSAEHVRRQLGDMVEMILDGGECRIGIESTIVSTGRFPEILRYGGVPAEEIEKVIGKIEYRKGERQRPEAPGRLPSHYSPRTPLVIIINPDEAAGCDLNNAGFLAFDTPEIRLPFKTMEVLSPEGNLRAAACNFFSSLHRLDSAGLDIIYAEAVPEKGLGRAIMDRLRRAARKK